MKAFGALCIIAAFVYAITSILKYQSRRLSQLDMCCSALGIIMAEVERLSTTDMILSKLSASNELSGFISSIEKSERVDFCGKWSDACACLLTELDKRDIDVITRLGSYLGRYERSQELEELALARDYFLNAERAERKRYIQHRPTVIGLFSASCALTIIFLL